MAAAGRPGARLRLAATCWRRLTEWAAAGVFDALHLEVLDRRAVAGPAGAVRAVAGPATSGSPAGEADGTWARIEQALQRDADAAGELDWRVQADSSVVRAHQHAAGAAKGGDAAGLGRQAGVGPLPRRPVDQDPRHRRRVGPAAGDRLSPGQAADTTRLLGLLDAVRVPRPGGVGRPRVRPDHLVADKAYSSRANRAGLRARKIPHAIPERDDQRAHRRARGRAGGRPPGFDPLRYASRNQVERGFNRRKQLRAVATRYDTQSMMGLCASARRSSLNAATRPP
jgi:transposase